jgi:hypothetical protein
MDGIKKRRETIDNYEIKIHRMSLSHGMFIKISPLLLRNVSSLSLFLSFQPPPHYIIHTIVLFNTIMSLSLERVEGKMRNRSEASLGKLIGVNVCVCLEGTLVCHWISISTLSEKYCRKNSFFVIIYKIKKLKVDSFMIKIHQIH